MRGGLACCPGPLCPPCPPCPRRMLLRQPRRRCAPVTFPRVKAPSRRGARAGRGRHYLPSACPCVYTAPLAGPAPLPALPSCPRLPAGAAVAVDLVPPGALAPSLRPSGPAAPPSPSLPVRPPPSALPWGIVKLTYHVLPRWATALALAPLPSRCSVATLFSSLPPFSPLLPFLHCFLESLGHHGFSNGDLACKVGRGLFQLGLAHLFCMQNLLRANSSAAEVKNEHVEAFACKSFYLLLLFFYLLSCLYLLLLSFFSCRLHLIGPFNCTELLLSNNILHIFILHAQVIKMDVIPSSHN